MQGAEVMQWSTQQRQEHPKVQASKQAKQASKTSKQGKIGKSEWGGVVLVAQGIWARCLYRPRCEPWCRRHTRPSGGQGYGHRWLLVASKGKGMGMDDSWWLAKAKAWAWMTLGG